MRKFTVESMFKSICADVFENYSREYDEDVSVEDILGADILTDSDVETLDVIEVFRGLCCEDQGPHGYCIRLTISDSDHSYEQMGSHFVLFFRDKAIFNIDFREVMGVRDRRYVGLQPDGLTKILEAIVSHFDDREGKLSETISDIAINAGCMITEGLIDVSDSREMVSQFPVWAKEFEEVYDPDTQDYLDAVDQFAQKKLREAYGVTVEA